MFPEITPVLNGPLVKSLIVTQAKRLKALVDVGGGYKLRVRIPDPVVFRFQLIRVISELQPGFLLHKIRLKSVL